MSFSIQDKVALVTGANRGIGKSIVETLLKNGAKKVYAAVRNPGSAAELVRASGGRVVAVELDLARPATIAAAAKTAKDALFEGLVASGWHTAALTMRLLVEGGLPIAGGIIGAGGEITWPNPTRPGDVLQVESEVLECRPSRSRPDRGIATIRSETRNQRGDTVQVLVAKLVVPRSAQSASPGPAPSR